jgi:hypothetical protein
MLFLYCPTDVFFSLDTGFSIAISHLVTPDASRATTVEDIETFDTSRQSFSPDDSILPPIGEIPGYLDVALKAPTLHAEARPSFVRTLPPSFRPPIQ